MSKYPFLPETSAVRRCNDRVASRYSESAVVAREVFRRVEARLDYLAIEPKVVVDLGCGVADSLAVLKKRYRKSLVLGIDLSLNMLQHRKPGRLFSRKPALLQADAQSIPLQDDSVDVLLASLMLPQCEDATKVFVEINRVLKPGGAVLFTSLGPDTMKSMLDVMMAVDPSNQRLLFTDMHDLGDMMAAAGLAQPVLDVEYLDVTYPSVDAMLAELRDCGGSNTVLARRRGLMSPLKAKEIQSALVDAKISCLTLELLSGHAWKGASPKSYDISVSPVIGKHIPIKPI